MVDSGRPRALASRLQCPQVLFEMHGENLRVRVRMRLEAVADGASKRRIREHRPKRAVQNLPARPGEAGAFGHVLPAFEIELLELVIVAHGSRGGDAPE